MSSSSFASSFFQKVSSSSTFARSTLVTLPIVIWINDTFVSFCRVQGSSMEPTLHHGDIVLVRKSDIYGLHSITKPKTTTEKKTQATIQFNNNNNNDDNVHDDNDHEQNLLKEKQNEERIQLVKFEARHCHNPTNLLWLISKPPLVLPGQVVVYKNPQEFPSSWNIKRTIGVGGQVVLLPPIPPPLESVVSTTTADNNSSKGGEKLNNSMRNEQSSGDNGSSSTSNHPVQRFPPRAQIFTSAITVPPYSLWVEGDNWYNSQDSRHRLQQVPPQRQQQQQHQRYNTTGHGPVSKKLLVGVAEYIIWPPSRIGPIHHEHDAKKQYPHLESYYFPSPRAYWP